MKQNIATTPEQSKRLLDCGVDPKSADFVWMEDNPPRLTLRTEVIEDSNPYILAYGWSLSQLLDILPQSIKVDSLEYYIEITVGWRVSYVYYEDILECFDADDLIECCVEAIEWLYKYGYKLNTI